MVCVEEAVEEEDQGDRYIIPINAYMSRAALTVKKVLLQDPYGIYSMFRRLFNLL